MENDPPFFRVMILGGTGLVGRQITLGLIRQNLAEQVIVCTLTDREREQGQEFFLSHGVPADRIAFEIGDIFVPVAVAQIHRSEIEKDPTLRRAVLEGVFGEFESNWRGNFLARLIAEHEPNAIIDCVNTATGISYLNTWDGVAKVRQDLDQSGNFANDESRRDLDLLMMSEAMPQLIRHVMILQTATRAAKTKIYLKIGTTGTGGMGLNIPYTHGESKPSRTLMGKTGIAFAQSGLLFLWGRTPDAPIVKEIKPAAMLGYSDITYGTPKPRKRLVDGITEKVPFMIFQPGEELLRGQLDVAQPAALYETVGSFQVTTIATGENGDFTIGEFEVITAIDQMEMTTAEEVAQVALLELIGRQTGREIIGALDASVLPPGYRGGFIQQKAIEDARRLASENDDYSVALGLLGPPELSKLLFEAELFLLCRQECGEGQESPEAIQTTLIEFIKEKAAGQRLIQQAISIGVPVLLPENRLIRGPWVNIPEPDGHQQLFAIDDERLEEWAKEGWIDLRLPNIALWQERLELFNRANGQNGRGSDAAIGFKTITAGEIVARIFNEKGGNRIKH